MKKNHDGRFCKIITFVPKSSPMRKHILFIVLFVGMTTMQAQDLTIWQKARIFLTKARDMDTTRIYQPEANFTLGLFTTGQKASFDVDVNFMLDLGNDKKITGLTQYNLRENLCQKIGLEVGYGNVSLGYGFEVGTRSAMKKRALAFNILGKSWGLHMNYYRITNPFKSSLTIGAEGDTDYFYDEFTSTELAELRSFSIDGYYVFNNKRFAYPAAYKKSMVQRRTAGSWMLAARYMQGSLYNSPEASWLSYNLLDCYSTLQASLGGGYSANIVLWHKDPVAPKDKGLRNLTVNLTAMPMITLFNYLRTTTYYYNEEGVYSHKKIAKILCYPMPNFIGSAAAGLTLGKFYFSVQFAYNWFYFRSRDAMNSSQVDIPDYVDGIDYHGSFQDWTLKGLFVYKF